MFSYQLLTDTTQWWSPLQESLSVLLFIPEVHGDEYKNIGRLSNDNPRGRAGEEGEKACQPLKHESESENY